MQHDCSHFVNSKRNKSLLPKRAVCSQEVKIIIELFNSYHKRKNNEFRCLSTLLFTSLGRKFKKDNSDQESLKLSSAERD